MRFLRTSTRPGGRFGLAALLLFSLIASNGCTDAPTGPDPADRHEQAAEAARLVARAVGLTFSGAEVVREAAMRGAGKTQPGDGVEALRQRLAGASAGDVLDAGCPTVVVETSGAGLGVGLVFGDDGCTADDGAFYAGRISTTIDLQGLDVRFDDFRSDDGAIDGALHLTFDIRLSEEDGVVVVRAPLAFGLEADALTVTTGRGSDEETVTLDADLDVVVANDAGAMLVEVTGRGVVEAREDGSVRSVAFDIRDGLGVAPGCPYPTSGLVWLSLTDDGEAYDALVDFGAGECDERFDVTVDGGRRSARVGPVA